MKLTTNPDKCSGCRLCLQYCTIEHFDTLNPKKAALKIEAKFPKPGKFHPVVCNQCGQCMEVCPSEAIIKEGDHYKIITENCTQCLACVDECPFGVIFTHDDLEAPIKCDNCFKCIEVCNTGALTKSA